MALKYQQTYWHINVVFNSKTIFLEYIFISTLEAEISNPERAHLT